MAELVREKAKPAKEEPAVTGKTCSDVFDDLCFTVALLMICAQYVATVYVFLKYSNNIWMATCLIGFMATPMVGLMLYAMLKFKDEHTVKYGMTQLGGAQVVVPRKAPAAENV